MGRVLGSNSGLVAVARHHKALIAGVAVALPALALYARTLLRDVDFWDTAEFQAIGPVLGIAHPTGYPAYTLLAWVASVVLQPFGNEALRANLLSAILVALAVGVVGATVTRLTGRWAMGVLTGGALAVATQAWAIALRADPHALHAFLAALLLLLLVVWAERVPADDAGDRWLAAAAVVFGISLANHGLTYLLAPGIALFVLTVKPGILRRPRLILGCALLMTAAAAILYAYLPLRSAMNPPLDYANPETWEGFRYLVLAEQFRGTFQEMPSFANASRLIAGVTLQLGALAPLAVLGVLVAAWQRTALMLLLAAWFTVNWVFALGYVNADIGRYYLVPLLAAAVLGGLGANAVVDGLLRLFSWVRTRAGASSDTLNASRIPATLAVALTLVVALIAVVPSLSAVPARFSRLDSSNDTAGRAWLAEVSDRLPQDSVVISWWSYSTTLWYGQYVEHIRPDVTVFDDSTVTQLGFTSATDVIDSYLGQRPVFLIRTPFDLPAFEQRYVLTEVMGDGGGRVFEVSGTRAGSGSVSRLLSPGV